ncbi:MAG: hypothetical protein KGS45_04080 [Planctomycetes bacterium]|nr:hypothetical protein [Planctomycetota bacterium]
MNWLFIDMDRFFASAERHLRPELRHRPVGVIPIESEGTCIIAASYNAKRHGIRVGTRVQEARALCPAIALVKARPDMYVKVHHAILRSVNKHVPIHKVYSIDEWATRLRGPDRDPAQAASMARDIKKQLLTDFSQWMRSLDTLSHAIDKINKRWRSHSIYMGSVRGYRHIMEAKIAFGRIPDASVNV